MKHKKTLKAVVTTALALGVCGIAGFQAVDAAAVQTDSSTLLAKGCRSCGRGAYRQAPAAEPSSSAPSSPAQAAAAGKPVSKPAANGRGQMQYREGCKNCFGAAPSSESPRCFKPHDKNASVDEYCMPDWEK